MALPEEPLRVYKGKGVLTFSKGETVETEFLLNFHRERAATLHCIINHSWKHYGAVANRLTDEASMDGGTIDGGRISIEKLVFYGHESRFTPERGFQDSFAFLVASNPLIDYQELEGKGEPITIVWGLTNFKMDMGCEVSKYREGKTSIGKRDKFSAILGGFNFTFIQLPD